MGGGEVTLCDVQLAGPPKQAPIVGPLSWISEKKKKKIDMRQETKVKLNQ